MATGHHSSSKRVLTPNHYRKTLNRRIQHHCAYTRRQREQGGRAPYQSRRSIFGKGRPSRTSIFCTASLPPAPLTTLCGDFPPSPRGRVQKDPKPRREGGRAERRSAVTCHSPRGVAPRCPGCGGMPGRRNAHSHPRTRTLLAAPPARTRLPPRAPRRAPNAQAERSRAARGSAARRKTPNCHPPALPALPLPPPPPHAPRVAACPLTRLTFPPHWMPRTLSIRLPLKTEGPQDQGGKAPNSMTRWVSSSPHSARNRPLNPSPMAVLPPNTIYSRTKLVNF